MPLRETVYPENVEPKDVQSDMQRQRIQGTTPGGRMKKKWKEHWCKCAAVSVGAESGQSTRNGKRNKSRKGEKNGKQIVRFGKEQGLGIRPD